MKFLKYFVLTTTAMYIIGSIMLINEGNFDIYELWVVSALVAASYYMVEK